MSDLLTSDRMCVPPPEYEEAWRDNPAIVKLGSPVLREVALPVGRINADTRALVSRMVTIMREARGMGLAAPQIGIALRLFIYNAGDGDGVRVLINPQIVHREGEQLGPEGCLSIPGLQGDVLRANIVHVRGFDLRGKPVLRKATELEARVIQHEYDHLDGVLFIDKALPATLEWLPPSDEDEEEEAEAATHPQSQE